MTKDEFKQNYPFYIKQDVIWGNMDAFKHVNNAVYFRYFEDVRMAFFEQTKVNANMDATQQGPILASTQCQYKSPLTYPDRIIIGTKLKEIAEKRFTMEYAIYSESQEIITTTGDGIIVYYDYKQGKSCEIPDMIRKNFNEILNSKHH